MNTIEQATVSELPAALQRSSTRGPLLAGVVVLVAGLCGAAACLWIYPGKGFDISAASETAPTSGLSAEDRAALSDLQSEQQKIGSELAELSRTIEAGQSDFKRIADQIAVLTSRIESLQNSAATASLPVLHTPPSLPRAVAKPAKRVVRPPKQEQPASAAAAPRSSEPTSEPSTDQR